MSRPTLSLELSDDALDQLADRLADRLAARSPAPPAIAPAYTVASLAADLGRSERSIRAAIARGELQAVKRGRGWIIGVDAVAAWAASPRSTGRSRRASPRTRGDVMARALGR